MIRSFLELIDEQMFKLDSTEASVATIKPIKDRRQSITFCRFKSIVDAAGLLECLNAKNYLKYNIYYNFTVKVGD